MKYYGEITNPEDLVNLNLLEDTAEPLINQWDEQWELGDISYADGTDIDSVTWIRSRYFINVLPDTIYYLKTATIYVNAYFYDSDKNYLGRYTGGLITGLENRTFTVPSNARYMRFASNQATYNHDISINYPATYTGYYPSALPKTNAHVEMLGNVIGMRGWNQLVQNGNFVDTSGWLSQGTITVSNGIATIITPFKYGHMCSRPVSQLINGHKYLLSIGIKTSGLACSVGLGPNDGTYTSGTQIASQSTEWKTLNRIFNANGTEKYIVSNQSVGDTGTTYWLKNIQLFDLTAMGLDSINSPEEFRALFPADYYPYAQPLGNLAELSYTVVSTW